MRIALIKGSLACFDAETVFLCVLRDQVVPEDTFVSSFLFLICLLLFVLWLRMCWWRCHVMSAMMQWMVVKMMVMSCHVGEWGVSSQTSGPS